MPDHDVIVIGAGFTGLTAAVTLMEAGRDVLLVEARQRVGGRAEAEYLPDGTRIDTGGQFYCRDMTHLVELAQQCGAEPVWTHVSGAPAYRPPISSQTGETIWQEVDRLRDRIIALDLSDPSLAGLTVSQWIDRQHDLDPEVAKSFRRLVMGLWCRAPEEISFTYLASNDRRITNAYPELEMFLAGTMQGLAEELAARLGERLRLSSPATCVNLMDDEVEVDVNGRAVTARHVIFAVPPVMARKIEISPPLPARLTKALDAWSPGCVIKLQIAYEKPFWREKGLSGSVRWSSPQGMYACDASHGDYFAIVIFIGGPLASDWHRRLQSELVAFVTGELAGALGEEARTPRAASVRDWVNDAWSDGAYSDVITDLGSTDAEAVMLEGLPRLRFACSELSPSFPGYIEGAIVAGTEAAQAVLVTLNG